MQLWNSWQSAAVVGAVLVQSVNAVNITIYQHGQSFAPHPLPKSHANGDGEKIISLFQNLGRSTVWDLVEKVHLEGDIGEPEGMVRLGDDRFVVSCGTYTESTVKYNSTINGTDRTPGAGYAHLVVYDGKGKRIADATLTKPGDIEYHNGGIDFDGQYIWATIAQYRPNTTAHVVRVDPYTLEPTTILHAQDHLGGIIHDTTTNKIATLNWGARNATIWDLNKLNPHETYQTPISSIRNPTYFIDYQDCTFLGHSKHYSNRPVMLCSGVATISTGFNLGGLAIVDVETMVPLDEVPITLTSDLGVPLTQNPVEVSVSDKGQLRMYFIPDQHNSTLYVYEAQIQSPFEFGGSL